MSVHVIRRPIGEPARLSTSRNFPTDRAADREAAAWRSTGEWQTRVEPGRAPRAACGRPHCARLYDHTHDDDPQEAAVKRPDPAGLLVDRWAGWLVRHAPSGLPMTPSLRLRRHAQAAMADLAATRADFTRPAEDLRGTADLRRAQLAAMPWYERARVCCADGEHYSPYTYILPSGRCSSGAPRTPREAPVVNCAAEAAEADHIAARGPRDLAQASPRHRATYQERYSELLAITRDIQHCPPCSKSWQASLEWTLPPAPIVLCSAGKPLVRQIAEHQEARYQQWRTTVSTQQDLIHRICAARHQGRRR